MSYPSFLWLREAPVLSGALVPPEALVPSGAGAAVPEETIADLSLREEIRERSIPVLRVPCLPEEIPMRQGIFRRLLEEPSFEERLASLAADLSETEQLRGELDRAETEEEKVLLFLPLMRRFLACTRSLAAMAGEENRAGEIGRFWKKWMEEPSPFYAAKRTEDILGRHDPALRLKIRGSEISAWERRRGVRDEIESILREMEMEDALPPVRYPQKAAPTVVRGYAGVHAAYYSMAADFWRECGGIFLGGERDIDPVFAYADELRFYLDVGAYFKRLRDADYPLAYPAVSAEREAVFEGLVDPSLLRRQIPGSEVVPNNLGLWAERGGERLSFFILSGANGGGKTTFLRASALAVLFFNAGCPVTARGGRCKVFDGIYTHFPSNESFESGGRFADECERADRILDAATPDSFAVFNETYSGTDERRSEEYSSRLAHTMYERGVFGIYVTHIHALTGGEIPTLAAQIDENDENRRTYKIRRVGGTSSSYAKDVLEKYGLDRASLEARLKAAKGGG